MPRQPGKSCGSFPRRSSQVLLFTSPGDGHGKTTTLARLLPHVARAFSGSVLVVDANTRNPELARRLEVATTWRLTDVLAGATHWMNAVRPTALPRMSLLPGGTDTAAAAGRRRSAAAGLLRELAGHYDLRARRCDLAGPRWRGPACRRLRRHVSRRATGRAPTAASCATPCGSSIGPAAACWAALPSTRGRE